MPGGKSRSWLEAHVAFQYAVLQQLYTANALTVLDQHEREHCRSSSTGLYCKMQVRLYWIGQGLGGD